MRIWIWHEYCVDQLNVHFNFFELLSLSQIQLMIYFINPKCICCDTYNDKSEGEKVQNLIIHFYLSCRCLQF